MGCSDTVAAGVATTNDEYSFAFCTDQFVFCKGCARQNTVLLRQHFKRQVNTFQLTTRNIEVTCCRSTCTNAVCIITFRQCSHIDVTIHMELHPLFFHNTYAPVYDRFVQFEVGNTIAEQSTWSFILVEDCNFVSHTIELIGCCQASRAGTNNGYPLTIAFYPAWLDISFSKSSFDNGRFVFSNSGWGIKCKFQYARLFAQCRTDAPCKFWEVVSLAQYPVCLFPFSIGKSALKFGLLVTQRTSPVTERHTAIHTP